MLKQITATKPCCDVCSKPTEAVFPSFTREINDGGRFTRTLILKLDLCAEHNELFYRLSFDDKTEFLGDICEQQKISEEDVLDLAASLRKKLENITK